MEIQKMNAPFSNGHTFATVFLHGLISRPVDDDTPEPMTMREMLGRRIRDGLWGSATPYELHGARLLRWVMHIEQREEE